MEVLILAGVGAERNRRGGIDSTWDLWPNVLFFDRVSFGQHTLVENAGNQDAARHLPEKHNVTAALHPAQAGTNVVTGPAQRGFIRKHLATFLKIAGVACALSFAPSAQSMTRDAEQIRLSQTGKFEGWQ
jgi:hypothetical protein